LRVLRNGDRVAPDFRALFEAIQAPCLAFSVPDLTVRAVNAAFLGVYAMPEEEVLGRGLSKLFGAAHEVGPSQLAGRLSAAIDRVLASRTPDVISIEIGHPFRALGTAAAGSAEARQWTATTAPVAADDGSVAFVVQTFADITPVTRAHQELAGRGEVYARALALLQQELGTDRTELDFLATEMTLRKRATEAAMAAATAARDDAQRTSQLKTRFLGMISHELRTPLTALCLQVERMQRNSLDLDYRHQESLERIAFSASRLREMIETLLEYARIEAGHVVVNEARFDLGNSVQSTVDHHRDEAEQRGLELRCSAPGAPALVYTDRRLVELVLSNLIDNAIKFTTGGRVDVTLGRSSDGAHRVAVTDSGPGIPEEQQKRIFEPFEQLDSRSPRQRQGGIGLGLALVRDIAGALGGHIELVSRPREGSTFTFVLSPGARDGSAPASESGKD